LEEVCLGKRKSKEHIGEPVICSSHPSPRPRRDRTTMIVSEARLAANRLNGCRSKGPLSPESKRISSRNSLKLGLTGKGIVTPQGDAEEIQRRVEALTADMKPTTPASAILIVQMAISSVRTERAFEQESASIAKNVRHAPDEFDEARIEAAETLFKVLGENPRTNLRKLRKSPEGVDRLIDAWRDLRADLTIDPKPLWTEAHLEQAAHLTGLNSRHARGSRLGDLSKGFWGDCEALVELEGDLGEEFRREWARSMLIEQIDAEIAGLEAHRETLDFERIELDRAEAGSRALFDSSKQATLARRYESEAHRLFFKALNEFRKVEAESVAKTESAPTIPPAAKVGSFRETPPPLARELARAFPEAPSPTIPVTKGPNGRPLGVGRPPKNSR
jgi:hypothetical protein